VRKTQVKINRRTLWAGIILAAGVIVAVACNRGADDPQGSVPKTSGDITGPSAADFTVKSTDIWISEEDRKWFKQHVPKFSVDGTVVTVSGHNPWDHPVQQGHAKQFWLKVFNKQDISQPFIGQAGPFTIDAKDSFSASVDIGYGYCFVEAELRLDNADNKANGGNPSYLFGAADLDVGGCKRPKDPPREPTCDENQTEGPCPEPTPSPSPSPTPTPEPSPTPNPCDEDFLASSEPNPCPTPSPSPTPEPEDPRLCFYNVAGPSFLKPALCAIAGGNGANWNDDENHCEVPFPGVVHILFNLTPGQSETGCLRKQDDD